MAGLTAKGYPYPDPTDPLRQGADAIKALAQAVDGKAVQIGTAAPNVAVANTAVSVAVVFPFPFSVAPVVAVVPNVAAAVNPTPAAAAWATAVTAAGFTLNVNRTVVGAVACVWIAALA